MNREYTKVAVIALRKRAEQQQEFADSIINRFTDSNQLQSMLPLILLGALSGGGVNMFRQDSSPVRGAAMGGGAAALAQLLMPSLQNMFGGSPSREAGESRPLGERIGEGFISPMMAPLSKKMDRFESLMDRAERLKGDFDIEDIGDQAGHQLGRSAVRGAASWLNPTTWFSR